MEKQTMEPGDSLAKVPRVRTDEELSIWIDGHEVGYVREDLIRTLIVHLKPLDASAPEATQPNDISLTVGEHAIRYVREDLIGSRNDWFDCSERMPAIGEIVFARVIYHDPNDRWGLNGRRTRTEQLRYQHIKGQKRPIWTKLNRTLGPRRKVLCWKPARDNPLATASTLDDDGTAEASAT